MEDMLLSLMQGVGDWHNWALLIGGLLIPGAQTRIVPALLKGMVWGLKQEFMVVVNKDEKKS